MLRIAVPNKGSLSGPAAEMLHEAGYRQRKEAKELVLVDPDNQVEFFFLRPRDIAVYVGSGRLRRRHHRPRPAAGLRLGGRGGARARLQQARPSGSPGRSAPGSCGVRDLEGLRIATSYTGLVEQHLAEHGVKAAAVTKLDGAVETAVHLGVADVIADVVETGTSLRNASTEVFGDLILVSDAVVIRPKGASTRTPRSSSSCAACRACWWPAATC